MLNKALLQKRIKDILTEKNYKIVSTKGCMDILAKNGETFLIKSLSNVDAFTEIHASSLQTISHFISAFPFVVTIKNNRGKLNDKIVYSRFGINVVTPKFLEEVLEGEAFSFISAKGRHAIEIDTNILRKKREEKNLSLREIAEKVGISKKAMYEIENKRVNPSLDTVKKLELILNANIKKVFKPKIPEAKKIKPKDLLQKRISEKLKEIGIENSVVYSAPFDLIGREKSTFIVGVASELVKMEASDMKNFSSMLQANAFFVLRKSKLQSIQGLPIILEKEILEMESTKELEEIILERIE